MMIRFRSLKSSSTTFPLCPQGQHLHFKLTRLQLGSLAFRSAVLPLGNLQYLITQTLLPGAKEVYEQLLLRVFNPIRFITDNGIRTQDLITKKDKHHVPKILQRHIPSGYCKGFYDRNCSHNRFIPIEYSSQHVKTFFCKSLWIRSGVF